MVKQVVNKTGSRCPAVLAILGWVVFVVGLIVNPVGLKIVFMSAARVLPEVLRP